MPGLAVTGISHAASATCMRCCRRAEPPLSGCGIVNHTYRRGTAPANPVAQPALNQEYRTTEAPSAQSLNTENQHRSACALFADCMLWSALLMFYLRHSARALRPMLSAALLAGTLLPALAAPALACTGDCN